MQNDPRRKLQRRLRGECLNAGWFRNLADARAKASYWRQEYGCGQPHISLGYHAPNEFAEMLRSSVLQA
jgi:transposase InsO family protein